MAASHREPVTLIAYRLSGGDAAMAPTSSESQRSSVAFSSSDTEFSSSATGSPARRHLPPAGPLSKRHASSLTSLFHRLNLRRSSTASSLEASPRKTTLTAANEVESSDDDGVLSKLRRKSKSASNVRRRKKLNLRRHDAQPDLHQQHHQLSVDSTTSSLLSPPKRCHSLDLLAEPVCPNCRLHSIATDSGVGSLSLTAPTDSPLWLGWHSSENDDAKAGTGFLAQAQLTQSHPNLADSPDLSEYGDAGPVTQQCQECGSTYRNLQHGSPVVRVEFEQDYVL